MDDNVITTHIGVHATHCCKRCGCKYGNSDCPVVIGTIKAVHGCEDCEADERDFDEYIDSLNRDDLYTLLEKVQETILTKRKNVWV